MRFPILAITALLAATLAGCAGSDSGSGTLTYAAPTPGDVGCTDSAGVDYRAQPVAVFETTMGTIEADIFADMAPATAANFIDLVESGFYNGTKFHRIISNFMMQGGDPNSKDDDPSDDGFGGPGYSIDDEFHHRLRHDGKGMLSMANSGPDSGGSQFFITFGPTPHLDDKHAVFGEVTGGMDVVDRVNAEAASSTGTPGAEVILTGARMVYPDNPPPAPVTASDFGMWTPDSSQKVGADGGEASFIVVAVNCADHPVEVSVAPHDEGGNTLAPEEGWQSFTLGAAMQAAFVVTADVAGGKGAVKLPLTLQVGEASNTLDLTVTRDAAAGKQEVKSGVPVEAHYLGMMVTGMVFDTSMEAAGEYAIENDYGYTGFSNSISQRKSAGVAYQPFSFTPGGGVIQGFTELAVGTLEGGTSAGRMPPAKAYNCNPSQQGCPGHLAGRTLLFQLEILEIDPDEEA